MQEDAVETERIGDEAGPSNSAVEIEYLTMMGRGRKVRPSAQEREKLRKRSARAATALPE